MKKIKFSIHPLFLVLGICMLFCGAGVLFVVYLITILLHELGHFVVSCKLGYHLENFCLLPQGAQLYGEQQFFSYNDEIKIAIAGPLVNVLLTICTVALWWIYPLGYPITEDFAFCNITTAMFNFLPILPLDGGRCLVAGFSKHHRRKAGIKFCNVFGFVLSGVCLVLFVVSLFNEFNPTFLIISIFLLIGILTPNKTNVYVNGFSVQVKKKGLERGLTIKSMVISADAQLFRLVPVLSGHNYNIVYVSNEFMEIIGVLHESELEGILETHNLSDKIKTIL